MLGRLCATFVCLLLLCHSNSAKSQPASLEQLQINCESGIAVDCQALGTRLKDGLGTPRDTQKARLYFDMACKAGIALGCNDLAFLIARADGGPLDIQRAIGLLERACSLHSQLACYNQAYLLLPTNPNRAVSLYTQACNAGIFMACYNLGNVYSDGGAIVRDTVLSNLYYRRACDGGIVRGCGALEINAENARLEARNAEKPVSEIIDALERDCNVRKARACNDLGMRLFEGDGMARDWERATVLFRRACEDNAATACFNLATMYSAGHSVSRDASAAAALFLRACDGANKLGCQTLAELYLSGDGIGVSPQKAIELFERLCTGGRALSCISLAGFHEDHRNGLGEVEALKWFKSALALDASNAQARLGINRIEPRLDARQRCLSARGPASDAQSPAGTSPNTSPSSPPITDFKLPKLPSVFTRGC
jgi:uncharacterized protein